MIIIGISPGKIRKIILKWGGKGKQFRTSSQRSPEPQKAVAGPQGTLDFFRRVSEHSGV